MVRAIRTGAAFLLCLSAFGLGSMCAGGAIAQTVSATRTSSFAYDAASGLLTQEVIEPNSSALRLETDYVYDAFGNKTSIAVSGVDITTRTSTFDALGQFARTNANALNQSESFQYDARFAQPTSHTGPNGLTTTWTYDSFGRKTSEVRPDGTQTKWSYQFCSGVNGGTASCVSGAAYLIQAIPLAADGATQIGPIGIVYFDRLDREVARDTQGFDGSTIRVSKQYDSLGRVQQQSRPYFAASGTPQLTTYAYDGLSRVVTTTHPDGSTDQAVYHGLVTNGTNGLNQTKTVTKDSQGQTVSVTDAAGKTTNYYYDPFGKLVETIDPVGNAVTATYDVRGRKIASSDPDLGAWTYAYDTASELVSQTDAKSQTTTLTYDILGRMTHRVEPDMTSVWVYDTAAHGIGKVASASITAGASAGYSRSFAYDTLGRPAQATVTVGGTGYAFAATYDANSRLSSVAYPSGLLLNYTYTSLGYAQQIVGLGGLAYWTANTRDAELHLTQQTAGNGVVTTQSFNAETGRLTAILAGSGNIVQNFSYTYDVLGNVLTRADANESLTESFTYDTLNRVTSATVGQSVAPVKTFAYNAIGNLLSKSDVGNYNYPLAGSALPHAVASISGGAVSTSFAYDPNGNQTSGLGRSIAYTSYNKPSSITQGSKTLFFSDDTDHQRFRQVSPEGTTLYFDMFGVHTELFTAATSQWYDFIGSGGSMVGVRVQSASSVTTRYFQTDRLGSIAVITDEGGNVVERDSYDAWGKRRFPNGADDPSGSLTSQTTRGYTGQEQLTDVGLVHLNGRVYDPLVGRMMSADPFVPDPMNGQAWNRYSYVINNPLALTDTNGYCFLGMCHWGEAIGNFLTRTIGGLFRAVPILGTLFEIAAVGLCTVAGGGPLCAAVAFASTTFVAGVTTGSLSYALKAGLIAGVTALAFYGVGDITGHTPAFGTDQYFENVAGHALVGCASAVASGGKCGPAALAGAVTSAAAPFLQGVGFSAGLMVNTVLGGLAAVAGGGKFANGAITGAFGYLFNAMGKMLNSTQGGIYTCQDGKSLCGTIPYY